MCAWEWQAIQNFLDTHMPPERLRRLLDEDKTLDLGQGAVERRCVFYDMREKLCGIYPVRPLICRLMGHAEFLPCPIGRVKEWYPDAVRIMQEYAELELKRLSQWIRQL